MPDVCIVIPCFNEEQRLRREEILEFLYAHRSATVCFVDDGSSDNTLAVVEAVRRTAPQDVLLLALPANQGKAEAVRQGVLHARASHRFGLIGYWDADLSTPLNEVDDLLETFARNPACQLAMGSRVRRLGSHIHRSAVRHYLGRVFSTCASLLLGLPVYDSQCGAKVLRADVVDVLFSSRFLTKWIFDVEILARLRNYAGPQGVLGMVTEVPLGTWLEVGGSKLRPSHIAKVPLELLRIHTYYNGQLRHQAKRRAAEEHHAAHV